MIRFALPVLAALAPCVVPAHAAATYTGTLYGTITQGTANYVDYTIFDPDTGPYQNTVDLAGTPIEVDFAVDLVGNYYDAAFNETYPDYIVSNVNVTVNAPFPLDVVGSLQNNNPNNILGFTDFTGNAHGGHFYITGSLIGNEPDLDQSVTFDYANALSTLGPLTGSGAASAGFYTGFGYSYYNNVQFTLSGGFVQAVVTPEPASWALLLTGFAAVGAALRRRGAVLRLA